MVIVGAVAVVITVAGTIAGETTGLAEDEETVAVDAGIGGDVEIEETCCMFATGIFIEKWGKGGWG